MLIQVPSSDLTVLYRWPVLARPLRRCAVKGQSAACASVIWVTRAGMFNCASESVGGA
jgi:hypothetical protein